MMRFFLALLLLASVSSALAGGAPKIHETTTTIVCAPDPVALNAASTCTATITDLGGQGPDTSPAGSVAFSSDGTGTFSMAACALVVGANATSSCSVTYTPAVFGTGTHTITGDFSGGADPDPATGIVFNPSSGTTPLSITYPVLTITAITPATGNRGESVGVTVTGTNFVPGATTLDLGANITVSALTVTSSTQLTATLTIADAASVGFRDVRATNPAPGGGSDTLVGGFEVRNPAPVIDNLTPAAVEVGSGAVVVTIDGSGFVSGSIAHFNGTPRGTTFISSTQLQMSLAASDTATLGSFPVDVRNVSPGGGTSNVVSFVVVAPGGSFDTVEPNAAFGTPMYTKLAGVAFGFDILATEISRLAPDTAFTGTVRLELLDATDDSAALEASGCRASWTTVQALPDQVFAAADNGRISVNAVHGNALRAARFRVAYPAAGAPTHVGCTSDAFAIRPVALAVSTPLTNSGTTGTPTHAAGTAFSMTATAIAGYDGTPVLDPAPPAVPSGVPGVLAGTFPAANPATGSSAGNAFTYTEVGSFTIAVGGIHDDTFTAVDQPDDCTADFSNTAIGGKYGCFIGSGNALDVGRFIPAYFDVNVSDACADAGGFTYSGQPFTVTITAREAGGGRTQNYAGAYARDVTLSDAGNVGNFEAGTNLVAATLFATGRAVNSVTTYRFPAAETAYTPISLRAVDAEGVSSAGHIEESTEIRSGRLVVGGSTAITTNDALVGVMLQTWQQTLPGQFEWAVHADDTTCTAPPAGDFSLDPASFTGNLSAGETAIAGFFFNAGQGALTLSASGVGNDGSVDVTAAVDAWLQYDWNASGVPSAPRGTVTFFEIFSSEDGFIERHEVIP